MFTILAIVVIALGLMLGFMPRNVAMRRVGKLLAMAALTPVAIGIVRSGYRNMSPAQQALAIGGIVVVALLAGAWIILGRERFATLVLGGLGKLVLAVIQAPFKLIAALWRRYA